MRKVFNFGAGPGMLPEAVLRQAQEEMLDWQGTGMSVMEVGHRQPDFMEKVAEQSTADLRELLSIPSNYHVLFLSGGARSQFSMIPMNLLHTHKKADYVDTGIWSKKAIEEAKRYGDIHIAGHLLEEEGLLKIAPEADWSLRSDAVYLHYTTNETIEGIQFHTIPSSTKPLMADMSSDILSKPLDIKRFGLIYAGAQKNIGQAGITIVIIRDDLIQQAFPETPTMFLYRTHADNQSLYNTPPTYAWYIAGLVFAWMKKEGGVNVFAKRNQRKAEKLYSLIDQYPDFYINKIYPDNRSLMNVAFDLPDAKKTTLFLDLAAKAGLVNLKGHKLAGGIRASIYNAMPEEGVDALVDFMEKFIKNNNT